MTKEHKHKPKDCSHIYCGICIDKGIKSEMKEELYFLTHLFQNKECPDGDLIAMGLMISAVSPFAKLINSRIEYLKQQISEGKK